MCIAMRCCLVMILPFASSLLVSGGIVAVQADENRFPYHALVMTSETQVYSGPSDVHYATEQLTSGATVEVHRHDPGGWCAIRPPRDSFSMVPESALEVVEPGLGIVREDGIQAWVGTRLGTVEKPLWQVRLRGDEEVDILGQVSWPNPEGHSVIWYQIAPPAGEFRWVKMSDLQIPDQANELPEMQSSTESVAPAVYNESPADKPIVAQTGYQEFVKPRIDPNSIQHAPNRINQGWRRATRSVRVAGGQDLGLKTLVPIGKRRLTIPGTCVGYSQSCDSPSRREQFCGFIPERLLQSDGQGSRELFTWPTTSDRADAGRHQPHRCPGSCPDPRNHQTD